ncbi:MAG: hypothetical protein DYH13_10090 [Alphaproteobacteria bacterium PRO2]|nr:hypothetical protein [Alphaproteobacteria bacterium PRO2]
MSPSPARVPLYYCFEYAAEYAAVSGKLKDHFGKKAPDYKSFYVFETDAGKIVPVTQIGTPSAHFPKSDLIGQARNRTPLVRRNGELSDRAREILDREGKAHNPDILRDRAVSTLPWNKRPDDYRNPFEGKKHSAGKPYEDLQERLMAMGSAGANPPSPA